MAHETSPAFKVADLTLCEWGRKEIINLEFHFLMNSTAV